MTRKHPLLISIIVVAVLGLFHGAVLAETTTGTLFKIEDPSTVTPNSATTSSPSFSLEANVGGVVSSGTSSPSFSVSATETQAGTTTPSPTPPPPAPGGPGIVTGGGGGGGSSSPGPVVEVAPAPTLLNDVSCPLYRNNVWLQGGKSTDARTVEINGSSTGVSYPSAVTWQKNQTLRIGNNDIAYRSVYATVQSEAVTRSLQRHAPGDVNGDGRVDDFDLSYIAGHWGQQWCGGDFNSDDRIDDFDLSILVSGWKP